MSLNEDFYDLLHIWVEETKYQSSCHIMQQHLNYHAIVAMGEDVLPLVFKELQNHPILLLMVLREITGNDPVPEQDRGNVKRMVEAWIMYGEATGIKAKDNTVLSEGGLE